MRLAVAGLALGLAVVLGCSADDEVDPEQLLEDVRWDGPWPGPFVEIASVDDRRASARHWFEDEADEVLDQPVVGQAMLTIGDEAYDFPIHECRLPVDDGDQVTLGVLEDPEIREAIVRFGEGSVYLTLADGRAFISGGDLDSDTSASGAELWDNDTLYAVLVAFGPGKVEAPSLDRLPTWPWSLVLHCGDE